MSSDYTVAGSSGEIGNGDEKKPILTRREFVLAALVGMISLPAVARFLAVVGKFISVPSRSFTGAVTPTEVPAGLERDLSETDPKSITFGEDLVFVWKRKGKIMAYSGVCPHAGCLVSWDAKKKEFLCPCHGGTYDLDAKVTGGPPPRGLFEHKVRVSIGRVYVGKRKDG
jgi:Rieske Fe-S protein